MYEGEINMVIHAGGGEADVTVSEDCIEIFLHDKGPGIKDIERAMQEGYSQPVRPNPFLRLRRGRWGCPI